MGIDTSVPIIESILYDNWAEKSRFEFEFAIRNM